MLQTIENDPATFLLLNNGITIVCSSLLSGNRKITFDNPQIVNGCQTSNVLFRAKAEGVDLTAVSIIAKVISTDKEVITNSIIKGTNSQNPVHIETFEITREFHKDLEDFINYIQEGVENRIYYERRSRQYEGNPLIKRNRLAGLETLAHSLVSVFMQKPHEGILHIVNLLEKYQGVIFVQGQSFYPYYTSLLMCLEFERLIREGTINRH